MIKNHTYVRKVAHTSEFLFGNFEKQYLFKKLLKPVKNVRTLIFTVLYVFFLNKEKHLETSLFYTYVPKILMI